MKPLLVMATCVFPLTRAYIRYSKFHVGKRQLWNRLIKPYIAWRHRNFVASTFLGIQFAGNTKDMLQRYIYFFGVWEPQLTRWIQERLAPGDTFIDVGANIGYFSLLASKLVGPSGTVVAIEASPMIYKELTTNLVRNGVQNVRAVNIAAMESTGLKRIYKGPEENIGRTTMIEEVGLVALEEQIKTSPLSAIVRPEEWRNARFIKIDVEGVEWHVAMGLAACLNHCRSDLEVLIEVNPKFLAYGGKSPDELLRIFLAAGFHPYRLINDYRASSYMSQQKDMRPTRIRNPIKECTDVLFSKQDVEEL